MHTSAISIPTRSRTARRAAVALAALLVLSGCTAQQRQGSASSYLIVDTLQGASGATAGTLAGSLASDVRTIVDGVAVVFADAGEASVRLAMRDPGVPGSPAEPTPANYITVTRYHVKYVRSDGHNTQGVDVPYEFDGATTVTVSATAIVPITLVRAQAKYEAPLVGLVGGGGAVFISTVAEVTFYGTDQAGRAVTVTGFISVNFSDWADPVSGGN